MDDDVPDVEMAPLDPREINQIDLLIKIVLIKRCEFWFEKLEKNSKFSTHFTNYLTFFAAQL